MNYFPPCDITAVKSFLENMISPLGNLFNYLIVSLSLRPCPCSVIHNIMVIALIFNKMFNMFSYFVVVIGIAHLPGGRNVFGARKALKDVVTYLHVYISK